MEPQQTVARHPKGFIHIAVLLMSEFFSYYGMRSLLVLFLTHYLLFSDTNAYTLYGAYTSLVWVTPIIGGLLADRFLGYYFCVVFGAILIFLGNVFLAFSGMHALVIYFAMALIICGYGFFKGNVSCLAGELYQKNDPRRNTDFSWLYVSGNIGALVASIACGWAASTYGWHIGFILASIGLFLGILFFVSGKRFFNHTKQLHKPGLNERHRLLTNKVWLMTGFIISIIFFMFLLINDIAGYLLALIGIISVYFIMRIFRNCNATERHNLVLILLFMVFGTVFWVFDQQNGSSVTLFVDRHIDRTLFGLTIPTPAFQAINAESVINEKPAVNNKTPKDSLAREGSEISASRSFFQSQATHTPPKITLTALIA